MYIYIYILYEDEKTGNAIIDDSADNTIARSFCRIMLSATLRIRRERRLSNDQGTPSQKTSDSLVQAVYFTEERFTSPKATCS